MDQYYTPRKNWLDLKIEDSSEDQQNTHHKHPKSQTILESQKNEQSLNTRRDYYGANKVQKGFFVQQDLDDQFQNYQVKNMQVKVLNNDSNQLNEQKISQSSVPQDFHQQTHSKQQKQQDKNNESIQKITESNESPDEHKFELKIQNKTKMFHLNISDSQESDLPESQNSQNAVKQTKIQKDQKLEQVNQEQNHFQQSEQVLEDFKFQKHPQNIVLDQIPKNQRLRAYIIRKDSGINMLWPQFQVKLQSNGLSLLHIKKQPFTISSVYKIYTDVIKDLSRYFGKIQSNISKSFYQIYISYNGTDEILRAEIHFQNFMIKSKQPRYFVVYLLKSQTKLSDLIGFQSSNESPLKKCYEINQNKDKILRLHTRRPIYNPKLQGFTLNFHDRIEKASIKNFILEDFQTQQQVLMFGRLNNNHFKLQISHPLNSVIGMAITLVQFQSRLME